MFWVIVSFLRTAFTALERINRVPSCIMDRPQQRALREIVAQFIFMTLCDFIPNAEFFLSSSGSVEETPLLVYGLRRYDTKITDLNEYSEYK
jgi:hypothetical protein